MCWDGCNGWLIIAAFLFCVAQMHKMLWEKKTCKERIAADEAEIMALEEREKSHIHPHVVSACVPALLPHSDIFV